MLAVPDTLPLWAYKHLESDPVFRDGINTEDFNFSSLQPLWIRKSDAEVGIKSAITAVIMLLGILGNGAMVAILLMNRPLLKSSTNLFILNLSIADFLYVCVCPVPFLFADFYQAWPLGEAWCYLSPALNHVFRQASVLTLSVISLDRLLGITRPLKPKMSRRFAVTLTVAVWVVAFCLSAPLMLFRNYGSRKWKDFLETWCEEENEVKKYWLCLLVFFIWIPTIFMLLAFVWIFLKLNSFEKVFRDQEQNTVPKLRTMSMARTKQKRKVTRMLFTVFLVFTLTWLPFQIFVIVRNFYLLSEKNSVKDLLKICWFVAHEFSFSSCALNPIIYGFSSQNLKRGFVLTFPFFFGKSKPRYVLSLSKDNGKRSFVWNPAAHLKKRHSELNTRGEPI